MWRSLAHRCFVFIITEFTVFIIIAIVEHVIERAIILDAVFDIVIVGNDRTANRFIVENQFIITAQLIIVHFIERWSEILFVIVIGIAIELTGGHRGCHRWIVAAWTWFAAQWFSAAALLATTGEGSGVQSLNFVFRERSPTAGGQLP